LNLFHVLAQSGTSVSQTDKVSRFYYWFCTLHICTQWQFRCLGRKGSSSLTNTSL